jgi:hypothetical protein
LYAKDRRLLQVVEGTCSCETRRIRDRSHFKVGAAGKLLKTQVSVQISFFGAAWPFWTLRGFTPKDLQVNISHEVRKIFKCFVINNLFRVIDAAIQGSVDCED